MATVRIFTVDPLADSKDQKKQYKEYEISRETAKAVVATIENHLIDSTPVSLTKLSQEPYYFFSRPVSKIRAFHLPHHTMPGDQLEIYDHNTKEKYKVTFTKEFLKLCYYSGAPKKSNAEMLKKALGPK